MKPNEAKQKAQVKQAEGGVPLADEEPVQSEYGTYPTGYDANAESNQKAVQASIDSGAGGIVSTPGTLVDTEEVGTGVAKLDTDDGDDAAKSDEAAKREASKKRE